MRRRLAATLVPIAITLVAGGCGTQASDLFAVSRTGTGAGAAVRIVVGDDGEVTCNGGRKRELPSAMLLDARALERAVQRDAHARRRYPRRPGGVLAYRVRTQAGAVAWADTSRPLPHRYLRLAAFARRVSTGVCGLAR
jgi:hypothetical protein